jgi:hypothetical protein
VKDKQALKMEGSEECSASGTHQLVGEREELVKLEATYANLVIRKKIRTLSLAYPQWRSIRGDGTLQIITKMSQ